LRKGSQPKTGLITCGDRETEGEPAKCVTPPRYTGFAHERAYLWKPSGGPGGGAGEARRHSSDSHGSPGPLFFSPRHPPAKRETKGGSTAASTATVSGQNQQTLSITAPSPFPPRRFLPLLAARLGYIYNTHRVVACACARACPASFCFLSSDSQHHLESRSDSWGEQEERHTYSQPGPPRA